MLSKLYSPSKRGDGFTLLELLVVVIIIGILAAIALPIFINQQRAVVDAAVKSDVRNTVDEVQGWRTLHNLEVPASVTEYLNSGGHITTSKGTYVKVAFDSVTSYTVCGYNRGGLNYNEPTKAWGFNSNTGHFSNFTVSDCKGAVNIDPEDPTKPIPDPLDTSNPHPSGGGGATPPPGGGGATPPPAGGGDEPATCPAPDDSAVNLTRPTTKLANATNLYLGKTRLSGDHDRVANAQQASDMQTVSEWVANYAKNHAGDTVDNSYVDNMAYEAYYGSESIGVYFYNIDEEEGSAAAANTEVYDYNDGYRWNMAIGSDPTSFAAEWDNDQNPNRVSVSNHDVESRPAILNTDGNQTEGYLHIVTGGDRSWKEYVPECGSTQQFGGSKDVIVVDPNDDCTSECGDPGPGGGTPGTTSSPLTVDSYNWLYSFDGPTAADEVAKKGEYPSMCYFDRDDPDQAKNWPFGNELCQTQTLDGTDNPEFGTQLIRTAELTGDDFPSNNKLRVNGDFDFINGSYQCSAGDGVHVLSKDSNIFTNEFVPYGPHYEYRGGTANYSDLDATDYWTVSTYEQCDTTTKTARVAILITYPTDVTHFNGAGGGGHTVGGAVFNYQGKQYTIDTSGATRFNRNDIFDRDHRSVIQYVPNTYHGQHIYANCNLHLELTYCQ